MSLKNGSKILFGTPLDLPGRVNINSAEVRELKRILDGPLSEGTVDQLGFGVLFDSIAENLFPWCSTLTTRAKYLLWSPAIVQHAVMLHVHDILGDTPRDQLNPVQLKALIELTGDTKSRDLNSTITKIESALAVALYYKYGEERGGLGIFGSRNLGQRLKNGTTCTQKLIGGRGLLSTTARYPNAIYWNSLSELGLYADGIDSKKKAILHLINGKSPWNSQWLEHIDLILETEIRPIWGKLGNHAGHPLEVCTSKWLDSFSGFRLDDEARVFLISRLEVSTPFWRPVLVKKWKKELKNEARTYIELEKVVADRKAKQRCQAANLAIAVCTPIRTIYQDLTQGKIESQCRPYSWKKLRSDLAKLKKLIKEIDDAAYTRNLPLFRFIDDLVTKQLKESVSTTSKPCQSTIQLIIQREKIVLRTRGKANKRLLTFREKPGEYGYLTLEARKKHNNQGQQDAEVSEITFRLGSAINFFNDLR